MSFSNIMSKHLDPAFIDSLDILADEIRKLTPVDTSYLRNSVNAEMEQMKFPHYVAIVFPGYDGKDGDYVEYAIHVEFGTYRFEGFFMFKRGKEIAEPKINKISQRALREALKEVHAKIAKDLF